MLGCRSSHGHQKDHETDCGVRAVFENRHKGLESLQVLLQMTFLGDGSGSLTIGSLIKPSGRILLEALDTKGA